MLFFFSPLNMVDDQKTSEFHLFFIIVFRVDLGHWGTSPGSTFVFFHDQVLGELVSSSSEQLQVTRDE